MGRLTISDTASGEVIYDSLTDELAAEIGFIPEPKGPPDIDAKDFNVETAKKDWKQFVSDSLGINAPIMRSDIDREKDNGEMDKTDEERRDHNVWSV